MYYRPGEIALLGPGEYLTIIVNRMNPERKIEVISVELYNHPGKGLRLDPKELKIVEKNDQTVEIRLKDGTLVAEVLADSLALGATSGITVKFEAILTSSGGQSGEIDHIRR